MAFNPNAEQTEGFTRELVPEGPHVARCVRVIEIGVQHSPKFDEKDQFGTVIKKAESNKAVVVFSLPGVLREFGDLGEKQAFISNGFGITISNFERSTMKQYIRALDPNKEITDLGGLLNRTCQLSVIHTPTDPARDKIDSVAPLLPGYDVPELDTEPFWYSWENPSQEIWDQIPAFQQDLIKQATNFPGSPTEKMLSEGTSDLPM